MCTILDRVNYKTYTGYKVVLISGNRYISPATHLIYKVGLVKDLNKSKHSKLEEEWSWNDFKFYNELMKKKSLTTIIKKKKEAINLLRQIRSSNTLKVGIVKMRVKMSDSSYLYYAYFEDSMSNVTDGYGGDQIVSMKRVV